MAFLPKILVISNLSHSSSQWERNNTQPFHSILEYNVNRAFQRYRDILPDMVILELDSEPIALELTMKFRDETTVPILMVSPICSDKFILDAYHAGVDEYILSPIYAELLLAKIRAWLRRSWVVPVGLLDPLNFANGKLLPTERIILLNQQGTIHLTNLELRLLYYLIGRHGYTVTTEELCRRIWEDGGGDVMRLKNVVYRLRRKIEVDPANPQYLLTIAGVGYQFKSF